MCIYILLEIYQFTNLHWCTVPVVCLSFSSSVKVTVCWKQTKKELLDFRTLSCCVKPWASYCHIPDHQNGGVSVQSAVDTCTNLLCIVTCSACGARFSSMAWAKAVGVMWLAGASMRSRARFWPSAYTTPLLQLSVSVLTTQNKQTKPACLFMFVIIYHSVKSLERPAGINLLCSCVDTLVFFLDLSWS